MKHIGSLLAGQWYLTRHDEEPEPYLLSPEEEDDLIIYELNRAKDHMKWKMADAGMKEGDILLKLSQTDFLSKICRKPFLQRANSIKNYELWQKEQREKEKQEAKLKAEELKRDWTANRVLKLMRQSCFEEKGTPLVINEDTLPLIKTLCFFISGDPRFETELGYSFDKGLLIRGVSGLGKTKLVKWIAANELNPIRILSVIEITEGIKRDGAYQLNMGDCRIIYLDDVGTEEHTVNYYGTKITWFKDFIELFYLKSKQFRTLMISTNNNMQEIEDKYGYRVRSRIREMFNIVDVQGEDMRQ